MVYNDKNGRGGLRRNVRLNKHTHTHSHTHTLKPESVHAHRTEKVIASEEREGTYEVEGRIGVGGENPGVNGDGDRTREETITAVEENE